MSNQVKWIIDRVLFGAFLLLVVFAMWFFAKSGGGNSAVGQVDPPKTTSVTPEKPAGASDATQPAVPKEQSGHFLSVGLENQMRALNHQYDKGRIEGASAQGIEVVDLDDLKQIAEDGIKKYSQFGGDINYTPKWKPKNGWRTQAPGAEATK